MAGDGGERMKSRLRTDLGAAMKGGRKHETALIRELIAVIDNAEAPPVGTESAPAVQHDFHSGSAEVERLSLDADQVRDLLVKEVEKRRQAAAEFDRLGKAAEARALLAEALLATHYVTE